MATVTLREASNNATGASTGVNGTLALLALGTFATGTDAFVLAGLVPTMAADLQVSIATAGLLITLFSITYAVSAPLVAALTGHWNRRRLLCSAQLVFVLGMLLQGIGDGPAVVALGRVIAAVGAAGYVAAASGVAAALVPPEQRGRALAIVVGGMNVATLLGVPLGVLVGQWIGWRATLLGIAGLGLIAAAGTLAVPKLTLPVVSLRARLAVLGRPGVLSVLSVTVAGLAGGFTAYTYLPALAGTTAHGTGLSWLLFAWGAAGLLGNMLAGRWADRWGPLPVLRGSYIALVVILVLLPLATQTMATALIGVALWGAAGFMTVVPQQHRLITLAPDVVPVVLGWNGSGTYAGMALGSALGGVVLTGLGASWLGPTAGLVALLALALTWLPAGRPQPAAALSDSSASRT